MDPSYIGKLGCFSRPLLRFLVVLRGNAFPFFKGRLYCWRVDYYKYRHGNKGNLPQQENNDKKTE